MYRHVKFWLPTAYGVEGHDLRAGDRAPDAPGLRIIHGPSKDTLTTRLFDIFTPTLHTVLIFAPSASDGLQSLVDSVTETVSGLAPDLVQIVLVLPKSSSAPSESFSGVNFLVKDVNEHAFVNYGLTTEMPMIVVVRPDDYVGAFVTDAQGVKKYFSTVFGDADAL